MVVNNSQKGLDVATFFASVERLEKCQFHKRFSIGQTKTTETYF